MLTVLAACTASAQIRPFTLSATLSGSALAQPVDTEGWGAATAILVGSELSVSGVYRQLSSPLPTLHGMPRGVNVRLDDGPAVRLRVAQRALGNGHSMSLASSGGTDGSFAGVFTLTDEQIRRLLAGRFHLQIYTRDHPTGELRGRLVPEIDPGFAREDLVGLWRAVGESAFWQYYPNGNIVHLRDSDEAGRHLQPGQTWHLDGNVLTLEVVGNCAGTYTFYAELLTDGRHRLLPLDGSTERCALGTYWSYYERVDH